MTIMRPLAIDKAYLTKLVSRVKHLVGCSPSYIAVEGDFHGFWKAASNLSAMEIFRSLSRGLNLFTDGVST
jgi:hypothetical protein